MAGAAWFCHQIRCSIPMKFRTRSGLSSVPATSRRYDPPQGSPDRNGGCGWHQKNRKSPSSGSRYAAATPSAPGDIPGDYICRVGEGAFVDGLEGGDGNEGIELVLEYPDEGGHNLVDTIHWPSRREIGRHTHGPGPVQGVRSLCCGVRNGAYQSGGFRKEKGGGVQGSRGVCPVWALRRGMSFGSYLASGGAGEL